MKLSETEKAMIAHYHDLSLNIISILKAHAEITKRIEEFQIQLYHLDRLMQDTILSNVICKRKAIPKPTRGKRK